MGRAHGKPVSSQTGAGRRGARHRARRRFNTAVALQEFNAAAAQRAHLAALTAELAAEAVEHAERVNRADLAALAHAVGQPADTAAISDTAEFNLHTELRVALDEGRRLLAADVDVLADSAVRNAAAGVLSTALAESDSSLSSGEWFDLVRSAAHADDPAAAWASASASRKLLAGLA